MYDKGLPTTRETTGDAPPDPSGLQIDAKLFLQADASDHGIEQSDPTTISLNLISVLDKGTTKITRGSGESPEAVTRVDSSTTGIQRSDYTATSFLQDSFGRKTTLATSIATERPRSLPLLSANELLRLRDQTLSNDTPVKTTEAQKKDAGPQALPDKPADESKPTDKKEEKASPLTGKKLIPSSTKPDTKPGFLPQPGAKDDIIRSTAELMNKLGREAPDKESYLQGPVTNNAWQTLRLFKVERATLNDVRTEINTHGIDSIDVWKSALKKGRVLGVGEVHKPGSPHRKFVLAHMKELADAGATHLAIELKSTQQKTIVEALNAGKPLNDDLADFFKINPEIFELLKAAKEAGLKVIAIDQNERTTSKNLLQDDSFKLTRDQFMAQKIDGILQSDEKNKVVFYGGGLHVVNAERSGDKGEEERVFDILRKKYNVTTIFDQTSAHRQAVSILTYDIAKPVAVPTAKAAKLAQLEANPPGSSWNMKYSNFDYIFIYPH